MKIVSTAKEMQEIDERAIIDYGVPSLELMENAGQGIVDALTRRFHDLSTKRILFFCGMGPCRTGVWLAGIGRTMEENLGEGKS